MTNYYRRGQAYRLECMKLLRADGWLVDIVERQGKYNKSDLFGLFDLCCIKEGIVKFIQVTSHTPHPHTAFMNFIHQHADSDTCHVEQWCRLPRGEWKKYSYFPFYQYNITHTDKNGQLIETTNIHTRK